MPYYSVKITLNVPINKTYFKNIRISANNITDENEKWEPLY